MPRQPHEARHAPSCPTLDACPRLARRDGVRRARRRGDGCRKRNGGPVQAHDRLHVDDRLHLSRAQLFGAPAVGRDLCRRATGLALRLYELQQREVFDQPGRRVDDGRGRAPDARSVRVRIRRGLLLLPRRARAELSNYWKAHATVSYKLTDKITLAPPLAYAPNVWQTGAWGTYFAGTLSLDLPSELLPADVGWTLSVETGRWLFRPPSRAGGGETVCGGRP